MTLRRGADGRVPRRILMTTDTLGGVFSYSVDLAEALGRRGVEVVLATTGGALSDDQRARLRGMRTVFLYESRWRLEWMDEPWADVERTGEWLRELEAMLRPDVLHLNSLALGNLRTEAPRVVVAHRCVLSWWRAVHNEPPPPSFEVYRGRASAGLAGAHAIVAPTHAALRMLAAQYGALPQAVVIPHGIDLLRWPAAAKRPLIMAAGCLWDPAKNVRLLSRVSSALEWPLVAAGPGEPPATATGTPASGVRLLGQLSSAAFGEWLGITSIFVHPARYEPFGLAPLEAAAAGCALVLADIESLREIWGDAAVYVSPNDAAALQRALGALIADDAERSERAARARARAARYNVTASASAYLDLYGRLLEQSR